MSILRLLPFLFLTVFVLEKEERGAQLYIMPMISWLTVTSGYETLPQNRSSYADSSSHFALHFAHCCSCDSRRAAAGGRAGRAVASGIPHRAHRAACGGRS